jgi:hypothetical protein
VGEVEFITGRKPAVMLVKSDDDIYKAVRETEDRILSKAYACTVAGYVPAYRSRLLYHWAVQAAKKEGLSDPSIVRGRKYGEDSIVYMFAMPFDQADPTEVSAVFGINGALLSQLEKSFDCYISVEKHQKSNFPFVYVDGVSATKIEGVASIITKAIEKKRKNRGTLVDLCG